MNDNDKSARRDRRHLSVVKNVEAGGEEHKEERADNASTGKHPGKLDPKDYVGHGCVVFVGFHPDDLDFHAAGLAASLTAAGVEVVYVVVTSGEKNGNARVREHEQWLAACAVGVSRVVFLRWKDNGLGKAYRNGRLQKEMAHMLRALRPYAVVSFCPALLTSTTFGLEHPDHRYGALALWDAIYPEARQEEKVPWWKFWREPLPGHQVQEVLWFGDDLVEPFRANFFLPVANHWGNVCNALHSHESQWNGADIELKATARALRAAKRWEHDGIVEEYHRIVIP
jgi:LmbE family N-acetylglucosaminyl deacetylase